MASEREARQYVLMRRRIAELRSGSRDIGRVIGDLEALAWEVQEVSEEWRNRFIEAWGGLEIPYALSLDGSTPLPTAADHDVADALDQLDALVREVQGGDE